MWKIAVAAVMLVGCGPVVAQTLSDCAKVGAAEERLACFDKLAAKPAAVAPAVDPVMAKARAVVAAKLKDPASARFEGLIKKRSLNAKGEPTDVVCGSVNGKNSYGAYIGATPFVFFPKFGDADIVSLNPTPGDVSGNIYRRFCLGITTD